MAIETTTSSSSTTIAPSSSSTTITSSTPHITSIHHLISVKLDHNNYLLWLTQFKPLLKGYGLEGFVDGSKPCPPRLLQPTDTEINPSYTQWQQQDQILLGWLLSSLSDPVLAQVVGISTSREVWAALERQYASKSRARIMQLRRELQTIRKGSQTMQQFFLRAKQLADSLASSGHPIQVSDLQQIILVGLDSAYDAIVTTLTTTVTDTSMDDFYAHLLAFDMRIEAQTAALQQIPVANVASQHRNNYSRSYSNQSNQPPRSYPNQSGYRNQNNRSRNRSNATMPRQISNTSGPCQICGRQNHAAPKCYYRFDKDFYPHASPTPPVAYISTPGSSSSKWIPDSGATHHLTSDFANLYVSFPYEGPDSICVGNGANLPIENIGLQHGEGSSQRHEQGRSLSI